MKRSVFTSDKTPIEEVQISDGQAIMWAWTLLEEDAEQEPGRIHNMCLSCSAVNVDEGHQCNGRQAA